MDNEGHVKQGDTMSAFKKGTHLELRTTEIEESSPGVTSFSREN